MPKGQVNRVYIENQLRQLCDTRDRHQVFSEREIARFCGCDHETIRKIGRRALKKLRLRLPPEVRDEFAAFLAKDRKAGIDRADTKIPNLLR